MSRKIENAQWWHRQLHELLAQQGEHVAERHQADQPVRSLAVLHAAPRSGNLSILAPAGADTAIPVSCVEQGRWAYRGRSFSSEDRMYFARGRASKAASVSRAMRASGSRRSDQSEVWDEISAKSVRMGVRSETGSMSDIYDQRARRVEEYVEALDTQPGQVGALFAIAGTVAGLDLLETEDVFGRLFRKLARSYALDALETMADDSPGTGPEVAARFLDIVASATAAEFKAVGLGRDLRFDGSDVTGGGLVRDDRVIHLAAFARPAEDGRRRPSSWMIRASSRRRPH